VRVSLPAAPAPSKPPIRESDNPSRACRIQTTVPEFRTFAPRTRFCPIYLWGEAEELEREQEAGARSVGSPTQSLRPSNLDIVFTRSHSHDHR
jgi:hypothetical protein